MTDQPRGASRSSADWPTRFEALLGEVPTLDGAHDLGHFRRVWRTAQRLMEEEPGADARVVAAACYFHDLVSLPKDHPQRHRSSRLAAREAIGLLTRRCADFPFELHPAVAHAIEAHSFSAGIEPRTLEARIVQDADRLEALGAIGIARVFHVSGQLDRALFDPADPLARNRALDDTRYAVDHFQAKLLRLPDTMRTGAGRRLARHNAEFMLDYLAKLCAELSGDPLGVDSEGREWLRGRFP
ncbi:phosphohydrolase [Halotalea alkalilenta]|uniref:phosphohydrolase n=1 Tax=Halotalea alkalilenta TaxID=376489 RepID=UPI000694839F|nr:phosphohydrolase [Halotalea alkalilenta]